MITTQFNCVIHQTSRSGDFSWAALVYAHHVNAICPIEIGEMPSRKYEHMPSYGQQAAKDEEAIRSCIDFAIVMAEYALKYQSELFGSQLLEVGNAVPDTGYKTRNKSLFDELPPSFTFADIKTARPEARDNTLRVMIYTWKREGRIVPTELNCWKKL